MFRTIKVRVKDAEVSIPALYSSGPSLEMKGALEISNRLLAGENGHDVTEYPVVVEVVSYPDEQEHQGSIWLDLQTKTIQVAINAAEPSFDRMVAQLAAPGNQKHVWLVVEGLRHTDDDGGTLHWKGEGVTGGYPVESAGMTVALTVAP